MPSPCTVSGTLSQLSSALVGQGKVLFQLTNIGTGNPIGVTGTAIIPALTYTAVTSVNGTFSISLWGNDSISPANTVYSCTFFDSLGNSMGPVLYSITGATFNLNTAVAVSTVLPPVFVPTAIVSAPTAPQTITGQSLTLTASAPLIAAGGGSLQGVWTAGPAYNISTVSETGNIVTVTTSTPCSAITAANQSIVITGVGVAGYNSGPNGLNGFFTASACSGSTFTYFNATSGLVNSSGGTVTLSPIFTQGLSHAGPETITGQLTTTNTNQIFHATPGSNTTIDQAIANCQASPAPCRAIISPYYTGPESVGLITTSTGYKVYNGGNNVTVEDNRANSGVLVTTAASVTSNVATLTLAGPLANWASGQTVNVYGFTGADTYFNGAFTLTAVGTNTISYALTHANASASTNGIVQNPKEAPVYGIIYGGRCYGQLARLCVNAYSHSPLDSFSGGASVLLLDGTMQSNGQQAGAINIFSTHDTFTQGSSTANYTGTDSEAYHAASVNDIAMPYLSAYVGQVGVNQSVNASITTAVNYAANGAVNAGTGTITNYYGFDAFVPSAAITGRNYNFHARGNWLSENGTHFDAVDASNATHPIITFQGSNVVLLQPLTNAQGFQFSNVSATPWLAISNSGITSQIAHFFSGSANPVSNAGAFLGGSSLGWAGLYLAEGGAPGQTGGMTIFGATSADHMLSYSFNGGAIQHAPQTIVLHSAYTNATTTFSTLSDGTRSASFPVAANTDYTISCKLLYQGSATTAGPKVQVTGPTSPTAVMLTIDGGTNATAYADAGATAFSSVVTAFGTLGAATTNFALHIEVGVANGANAGTVAVQLAANGAGTLTVQPGSWCRIQ